MKWGAFVKWLLRGASTVLPAPHVPSRRDEIEREARYARDMRIRMDMLAARANTQIHSRREHEDDRRGVNGGSY